MKEFQIEKGLLRPYVGNGGAVVCEGVEFLHPGCLRNSPVITLPSSLRYIADGNAAFLLLKKEYDVRTKAIKTAADKAGAKLSNVFRFCEEVFGDGQELLILVTELTISYYGAHFISRYGCKEYFEHNKELLFFERQKDIIRELEILDLDE